MEECSTRYPYINIAGLHVTAGKLPVPSTERIPQCLYRAEINLWGILVIVKESRIKAVN